MATKWARQALLTGVILAGSWWAMQAIHELGHVLGARLTGGQVQRVVLHPLSISRTDLAENPRPLIVAWAGPVVGVMLPLLFWGIATAARLPGRHLLCFFAGFCLIANGLYIALGSFHSIGDCGDLLHHGSAMWHLWLFGALTAPLGLFLWHGMGPRFGFGRVNVAKPPDTPGSGTRNR